MFLTFNTFYDVDGRRLGTSLFLGRNLLLFLSLLCCLGRCALRGSTTLGRSLTLVLGLRFGCRACRLRLGGCRSFDLSSSRFRLFLLLFRLCLLLGSLWLGLFFHFLSLFRSFLFFWFRFWSSLFSLFLFFFGLGLSSCGFRSLGLTPFDCRSPSLWLFIRFGLRDSLLLLSGGSSSSLCFFLNLFFLC